MSITLLQISNLLDASGILYGKVRGAVIKKAAYIYSEPQETPNHAMHVTWARDVLLNGNVERRTQEMYRLTLTNEAVVAAGENALDSDIEWIVSHFLDELGA
jgi:hypothetical protein